MNQQINFKDRENKFAELLVAVDPGLADTPISKISISSNDKFVDPVHEVDISAPLSVSSVSKCHFVCIYLKEAIHTFREDAEEAPPPVMILLYCFK